nr:hypothetical protein [Polymorphobacter sp.]
MIYASGPPNIVFPATPFMACEGNIICDTTVWALPRNAHALEVAAALPATFRRVLCVDPKMIDTPLFAASAAPPLRAAQPGALPGSTTSGSENPMNPMLWVNALKCHLRNKIFNTKLQRL